MKKHHGLIGYISPHAEAKEAPNAAPISEAAKAKKAREEERIEKHSRLLRYLENKRLKEELDFIDRW